MNKKALTILCLTLLCITVPATEILEGDFATITIGTNSYTNAHLRAYSLTEGSLRHDGGLEKVSLAELPEPARSKFYDPERVKAAKTKASPAPKKETITEEYAARINSFAEKFDMTVDDVMRFDYVLPKRGLSLADFGQALISLDKARDKALGYHPDIPRQNKDGRRLKAGDPMPGQSQQLSEKEEDTAKMLKLAGYPSEDPKPTSGAPSAPVGHKRVKADVRFSSTTIGIKNLDQASWPALNIFINGDPPFAYRYVIGSLAPGEAVTVQLVEFAKDKSGERFDPSRFKLTKVWIGGNDYDYEAYGF